MIFIIHDTFHIPRSPFLNLGLWTACFNLFRHPKVQFDHIYHGCYHVHGDDFRMIVYWMVPGGSSFRQFLESAWLCCWVFMGRVHFRFLFQDGWSWCRFSALRLWSPVWYHKYVLFVFCFGSRQNLFSGSSIIIILKMAWRIEMFRFERRLLLMGGALNLMASFLLFTALMVSEWHSYLGC